MNNFNIFTLTQQAEVESPSLFPFPFHMHFIFACIGAVFFAYRFYTQRRPFQLIMAAAIPLSLIVWISESKTIFYGMGIAETILILAAIVTSFIFKAPGNSQEETADAAEDASGEDEISSAKTEAESSDREEES